MAKNVIVLLMRIQRARPEISADAARSQWKRFGGPGSITCDRAVRTRAPTRLPITRAQTVGRRLAWAVIHPIDAIWLISSKAVSLATDRPLALVKRAVEPKPAIRADRPATGRISASCGCP